MSDINFGPTVTLTVVDGSGNSAACTATITVLDTVAPTTLCQDVTLYLDSMGSASLTAAEVDSASADASGIDTMVLSHTDFGCGNVGENTVTLQVTDVNGLGSSCTATVTVLDQTLPTALCKNLTVALDAAGQATVPPTALDNGSTDACGIDSLALSQSLFDCDDLGVNTVILAVYSRAETRPAASRP